MLFVRRNYLSRSTKTLAKTKFPSIIRDIFAMVGLSFHSDDAASMRHHDDQHSLNEITKNQSEIEKSCLASELSIGKLYQKHSGAMFLNPRDLTLGVQKLKRTIVFGGCVSEFLADNLALEAEYKPHFYLTGRATVLPDEPPHPPNEYDFFVIQLLPRIIIGDHRLWALAYDDLTGHRTVFDEICADIDRQIDSLLVWTQKYGIPAFVTNFLVPQADLTSRMLPRYDLRNSMFFFDELNKYIESSIRRYKNTYILDVDRISASFGRRYVQDDSVMLTSHSGLMPTAMSELPRIESMPSILSHYDVTWPAYFRSAFWEEALAMHRTLHQIDTVKLVVMDLDDTLWMGVSGDQAEVGPSMMEGWPLGICEALMYLKKRGVLIGIISKNDEESVREIWPKIFGHALH